ncbi:MAG: hypothetical protein DWQ05_13270 [Calditrichaeota bacterium]|nr:MAG: hypothetical protein DWQ05_13270 [Calditrichota bacterium]
MLKNITLSADEELIKKARKKSQAEHMTLNENFRRWLNNYVHADSYKAHYEELMKSLTYAKPGQKFSRDELNER